MQKKPNYAAIRRLAAYLNVGFWSADFSWPVPNLWLKSDDFVGKLSAMDQPTRPPQLFIPLGSVNK